MSSYSNGGPIASRLVTWLIVGFLAILALKLAVVTFVLALKFGLVLLFTVGPLLLIGWLVLRALRYFSREEPA